MDQHIMDLVNKTVLLSKFTFFVNRYRAITADFSVIEFIFEWFSTGFQIISAIVF